MNEIHVSNSIRSTQFDIQKSTIQTHIENALCSENNTELFGYLSSHVGEKGIIDQAFREVLSGRVEANMNPMEPLLSLSIECAEKGLSSIHLPVTLLSDLFDCLTLDQCEQLFSWVEDRVHFWQKDLFFNTCKNRILRTCNDLLRRLSRSQNTVFCGRTLVFLAKIFPLSERSGLNINSEFNVENVTLFSSQADDLTDIADAKDDSKEEGEMDESPNSLNIDYNMYRKFWQLQDFFRQPNLCYTKISWKQFSTYSHDVLAAFSSYKLDDVESSMRSLSKATTSNCYFAKYLTNQKLLELELSDSNFRRYVLIQFLILFQYLQSSVKSRHESLSLTEDQSKWIKENTERIYKLLKSTPPNGEQFSKNVENILKREEYWNNWKNEGCPSFKTLQNQGDFQPPRKKARLGDLIRKASENKEVLIGTPELNRLWSLHPSNWEACKSESRNYVPTLDSYFKVAVEEADKANGIEERYKHVNDINYSWRALRLLSQKSPLFFLPTPGGQPQPKTLAAYLESMVSRLAPELPPSETEVETTADMGGDSEDELLKNSEEILPKEEEEGVADIKMATIAPDNILSNEQTLSTLSTMLEENWIEVATSLKFAEDEIKYFKDHPDATTGNHAQNMLKVWLEQNPDDPVPILETALQSLNLKAAAEYLSSL